MGFWNLAASHGGYQLVSIKGVDKDIAIVI
jgi:hypothetical protein